MKIKTARDLLTACARGWGGQIFFTPFALGKFAENKERKNISGQAT